MQIDLIEKKINEIQRLHELYIPKILTIDPTCALLIGGQSSMDYGRDTVIKKTCHILSLIND